MSFPAPVIVPPSQSWDGNDGSWSTFLINVGTPGQEFRLLMSTTASSTYLPMFNVCSGTPIPLLDCLKSRGILPFNSSISMGFQERNSSSWNYYGSTPTVVDPGLIIDFEVSYGSDTLHFGSSSNAFAMTNQLVAGYRNDSLWLGLFGLGNQREVFLGKNFFENLNLGQVPSFSYSYGAGAKHRHEGVVGSLILGGYDTTRFEPSGLSFDFGHTERMLSLGVQSISSSNTLQGDISLTSRGHLSTIDSTVSQLWLPNDVCDQFVQAFGLEYDEDTELFLVNDSTHEKLQKLNPRLTFRLGDTAEDTGSFVNIVLPYAAFDLQASYPFYRKVTNYFPIRRASGASSYTLGRAFLQEAYLIVNYDNLTFSINQAIFPDPLPDRNVMTIYPSGHSLNNHSGIGAVDNGNSGDSDGSNEGTGVGIVVGVFSFLLIIPWLLWLRKRISRAKLQTRETDLWPEAITPQELASNSNTQRMDELSAGATLSEMPSLPPPVYEIAGDCKSEPVRQMIGSSAMSFTS